MTATQSDYDDDSKPPGTYLVEIEGVVDENSAASATTTVAFTLSEICNDVTVNFPESPCDGRTCTLEYTITEPNYSEPAEPQPFIEPARCSTKYLPFVTIRWFEDSRLEEKLSLENGNFVIDEQDLTVLQRESEAPDYKYKDSTFPQSFRAYLDRPDGSESRTPHYQVFFRIKNPCRQAEFAVVGSTPDKLPPPVTNVVLGVETEITFDYFSVTADFDASICGNIAYEIKYDNSVITTETVPMKLKDTYLIDDLVTLIVLEDNVSQAEETILYVTRGFFETYPETKTEDNKYTRRIRYEDPCTSATMELLQWPG